MATKKEKSKFSLQAPRGMRDILPEDYSFYKSIYDRSEDIANYYGFQPIQTPHLEKTELFIRSVGETTDIVEKQMYTLRTRGGDQLVLRPEGTAPIMRAYLEHGMHTWPQPVMFQYKGSFFRHERPQKGRFREFQHFGLEILGEEKAIAEASVIRVLTLILEELKIGPVIVHINSIGDKECRSSYKKELVSYYKKHSSKLCKDCKKRISRNPFRLLDCKEKSCIKLRKDAPQIMNHLCALCKQHFKEVLEFLDSANIPYFLDNYLVRGLDYYSRTVFEIFEDKQREQRVEEESEEDEQPIALAGGGRYDALAKSISNKNVPGAGGALGMDRIVETMKEKGLKAKPARAPKIFFIQLGNAAKFKSLYIIETLRKANLLVAQSISKDSLKTQLRIASKLNIPYALILGQKEALEDSIIIRDMNTGNQETAPLDNLAEIIKKKIK